ncbi:hypothetical protein PENTCL1PPCAC_14411, partial [Pristionchus entomophagus]
GRTMLRLLIVIVLAQHATSFTYSCEELVHHFSPHSTFVARLTVGCVILQEDFSNFDDLKKFRLFNGSTYTNFVDIAGSESHCVRAAGQWNLYVDQPATVKCDQQFSLVLTEELDTFIMPLKESTVHTLKGRNLVAVPQTGMWIHKRSCSGSGQVTIATGAGPNADDNEVMYRSWTCDAVPDWIFSFDIVITIDADDGVVYTVECSSDKSQVKAQPGDAIAILTSGISNNLQNLQGYDNEARVQIGDGG